MDSPINIKLFDEKPQYFANDVLRGSVALSPSVLAEAAAMEVSVLWQTEGKGDQDIGIHYFAREAWEIPPSGTPEREFSLVLPPTPVSYHGVILKIHWCVRAKVFRRNGREWMQERRFVLNAHKAPYVAPEEVK